MKLGIYIKATLSAAIVAIPFAISGGCIWRNGVAYVQNGNGPFYYFDFLGALAYRVFGFPITYLAMKAMPTIRFEDHRWAIPTLSALVIIQWVIWANLTIWTYRRLTKKNRKEESQQSGAAYVAQSAPSADP